MNAKYFYLAQPFRARGSYGSGKVHVVSRSGRYTVLGCTGRAVDGCLGTDEPVDCRSCRKRFSFDPELLGISSWGEADKVTK